MTVLNQTRNRDHIWNDLTVAKWPSIPTSVARTCRCYEYPQYDHEVRDDGGDDGKYSYKTMHMHCFVSSLLRCVSLCTHKIAESNSGFIITQERRIVKAIQK